MKKKQAYLNIEQPVYDIRRAVLIVLDLAEHSHYPKIEGLSVVRSYVVSVQVFLEQFGIIIHPIGDTDEGLARSFLLELERVGLVEIDYSGEE